MKPSLDDILKLHGNSLSQIETVEGEIAMERINTNPFHLKYVVKQTESMCLEALRKDGLALEYVKEKTEKLVLEAVRNSGFALQFS